MAPAAIDWDAGLIMLVLGVDSSTMAEGIALAEGDRVLGEVNSHLPATHSERLLPAIRALLERLSLRIGQVDGFAVTLGPGSFTGVRIGIATVQGLALSCGRPAVGISTLEALAWWGGATRRGWICPFMNAGRGEVYGALFRSEEGTVRRFSEDRVCPPELLLEELPADPVCFPGEGAGSYRNLLEERPGARPEDLPLGYHPFLGGWTAVLGGRLLEGRDGREVPSLRPNYLRNPDAQTGSTAGC